MSSSEEEEEFLVHVEFNGMLERDVLDRNPELKVIGVEGRKPMMQIGNQTFIGEYEDIVGTALFFEEDPAPAGGDPVFLRTPEHQLRYACKTRKLLRMSRVFLKKREAEEETVRPPEHVAMEVDTNVANSSLEKLMEATTSGAATQEVEQIVEEQVTSVIHPSPDS